MAMAEPAAPGSTEARIVTEARRPLWLYAKVLRRLRPQGSRLLQVGCGDGSLLRHLVDHYEVYGFDIRPRARNRCRVNVPGALVIEDWEARPEFGFDVVVSIGAFGGRGARAQVRGLLPSLAPEGALVMIVPNPGGWGARLKRRAWGVDEADGEALLSEGQWKTLLRDMRLHSVAVLGDGLWDPPYSSLMPVDVQAAVLDAMATVATVVPWVPPLMPRAFGESLVLVIERAPRAV